MGNCYSSLLAYIDLSNGAGCQFCSEEEENFILCVMQADHKKTSRALWAQISNMKLAQRLINALQDEDLTDISACENLLESYFAQACPFHVLHSLPL